MTRTLYEAWPAKGSAPLLSFESRADALKYAADRAPAVPGLAVVEAVTITERRELWRHVEKAAA